LEEWPAEQVVRVLAPMGLIFDANSSWLLVSACAGQPGCAKSITDVRADVAAAVESGRVAAAEPEPSEPPVPQLDSSAARAIPVFSAEDVTVAGRQHWSGCDRRCGRPRGAVTDVVATADGYRVD
jgi:precorrin-3B synthase